MPTQETLRSDLHLLEPKEFYMKYIVKSQNWYFSDYLRFPQDEIIDKMDYFKEIVSTNFGINFHNVQIVGSAKLGFSLSPHKLLIPFHDEVPGKPSSDVDIAIVSDRLFLRFWDDLRHINGLWHNRVYYNHLTESVFRGYINGSDLQKIAGVKTEWDQLIRPINVLLQDKLGIIHPITYRLYRGWDDIEDYQLISISKAKKALEDEIDV